MSIRNNGCIFARCATKRCPARVWLRPYQLQMDLEHQRGRWRCNEAASGQGRAKPKIGSLEISTDEHLRSDEEPLTSGDETDEVEEDLDPRQLLQLLSLEESQQRLREARPPEAPAAYQKRWGRVQTPG